MNDNILDGIEPAMHNMANVQPVKKDYKNYIIIGLLVVIVILVLYVYFGKTRIETVEVRAPKAPVTDAPPKKESPPEIDEKTEKDMAKKLTEEFPVEEEEVVN